MWDWSLRDQRMVSINPEIRLASSTPTNRQPSDDLINALYSFIQFAFSAVPLPHFPVA